MDAQIGLVDLFNEYFEVVRADTSEKLLECYRLRYEVYCKEALIPGFNTDDYPDGIEFDQYDERSDHCLLMHKPTGCVAGTVRIILPSLKNKDFRFPLEKVAGIEILPRIRIGEISRLILAPEFRSRRGEDRQPQGVVTENLEYALQRNGRRNLHTQWEGPDPRRNTPRRIFPHAALGLFVAIMQMSFEKNLSYWYAGMEPVCWRFLRSFGIDFTPISPIVDYYGPCKSYFGYIPAILENIYRMNRQVWVLLTDNGALSPPPE